MTNKGLCKGYFLSFSALLVRSTPHPVTVTTRIITYLVGNPYKPSFATVTGWGVVPIYQYHKPGHGFISIKQLCLNHRRNDPALGEKIGGFGCSACEFYLCGICAQWMPQRLVLLGKNQPDIFDVFLKLFHDPSVYLFIMVTYNISRLSSIYSHAIPYGYSYRHLLSFVYLQ